MILQNIFQRSWPGEDLTGLVLFNKFTKLAVLHYINLR